VDSELTNLSFHDLTPQETRLPPALKRLLGLNLNFCPTPRSLSKEQIMDGFPHFERCVRLQALFRNKTNKIPVPKSIFCPNKTFIPPLAPANIETTLSLIKDSIQVASWTPKKTHNLNRTQRILLKTLMNRQDLKVVLTDKNLGPAILTRQQYIDLCLDHLMDTTTYIQKKAPAQAITKMVQSTLRSFYKKLFHQYCLHPDWNSTKIIKFELEEKKLNKFYGLAKIHKPKLCIRPIVSNAASILQGLSKWLDYKLRPYLLKTTSYLKDSDTLLQDIRNTQVQNNHILITFDVVSLYTSIPTEKGLKILSLICKDDEWCSAIVHGMSLILKYNYFEFGDTIWHQITGTAMGTPVAPTFASLYLAYFEETFLLPQFKESIEYFKRYIDDGFLLWKNDDKKPYEFKRFLALFTRHSGLKFTYEKFEDECPFLDLWILKDTDKYKTKTHQKQLNLYLYIPANSAHPPGVLKGLIYGLIKKYHKQNSSRQDYLNICSKLFSRLQDRGYKKETLKPLFVQAHKQAVQGSTSRKQLFYKIPYDPNGPSKDAIKKILQFPRLLNQLKPLGIDQLSICYLKPPTLKRKLCRTSFSTDISPTPASQSKKRSRLSTGQAEDPITP
jgi:hypothetical protein